MSSIVLRPISTGAAEAILAGRRPDDVRVAADYPTEFSSGVAQAVGAESSVGPFFVQRADDGTVVGEIGGSFVAAGVMELGYAIVESCWGRGYATEAVRALISRAQELDDVERVIAHTPIDRPASGRVLAKVGFRCVAEVEDEHDGVVMRVQRWELPFAA